MVTVPGTSGVNAYTTTGSTIILPVAGNNVAVPTTVGDTSWMVIGQYLFGGDGAGRGTFRVVSKASSTSVQLLFLGNPQDSAAGTVLAIGSTLSPSGQFLLGTLPTALSDNSTGVASNTIAAGVGVVSITIPLSSLATGIVAGAMDIVTTYTPGYAFKILDLAWVTTVAGTGAGATQAFNLAISGTNVTGGVVTVTLANTATVGVVVASASSVSALNTGTATSTISLKKAAGTVFTAGAGFFLLKIQNSDTSNAFASIAADFNTLLVAL